MNTAAVDNFLLAGDIGGTKPSLAMYQSSRWPGPPLAEITRPNHRYGSLAEIIGEMDISIFIHVLIYFGRSRESKQDNA